jgi:hypothetical protein
MRTDPRAAQILSFFINDEDFAEWDGEPPLSHFLLWGIFTSYTERVMCEATGLKSQAPPDAPARVTPLEALAACRVLAEQLLATRWPLAADARKDGNSWAEIGAALGMTKQAAWEGFRKYADEPPGSGFIRLHDEYRTLAGGSADG